MVSKARKTASNRRKRLWVAQDGLCFYCGNPMMGHNFEIDHVLPKSKGGHRHKNSVACHWKCNRKKSNRLPTLIELNRLDAVYIRAYKTTTIQEIKIEYGRKNPSNSNKVTERL